MTVVVSRRDRILRPYAQEKMQREAALMNRAAFAPQFLGEYPLPARGTLLYWAMSEWARELPIALHYDSEDVGVSDATGAPRWRYEFFSLLTAHALDTEAGTVDGKADPDGETYLHPMQAALYRIHGPDPSSDVARVARFLFSLPCLGWDWRMACAKDGVPNHAAHAYTEGALLYWWRMYERCPPARTIRAA